MLTPTTTPTAMLAVVLVNRAALDRSYLERHARAHGVDDLLARLLGDRP